MTLRDCVLCLILLAGGCATGPTQCQRDPIVGRASACQPTSGSYVEAAGTAVAAGAAWAVAGCTVNGCEPPFRCNAETKMCERIRCHEGGSACPPAYTCDPDDQVCR